MSAREPASALPGRPLGRSKLPVTPLCFGGSRVGRLAPPSTYTLTDDAALDLLRAVFQSPIKFVDTAAAYGDGESERRIGLALRELGGLPSDVVLATKADRDLAGGDFSASQARRSVERSLRLLGLERLHLLYLHDPEYAVQSFEELTAPGGAVEVLVRLKDAGLVDALGIAAGPIPLLTRFVTTDVFDVVLTHNRYTLLNRVAEPLLAEAHRRGLGIVNGAPFGAGLLAKGPSQHPRYAYRDASPELLERAHAMERLCTRYNVPLRAAALQFSLRDPRIHSTAVGVSRPEHLDEILALASHPIPDALWPQLDALAGPPEDPQR